MEVFGGAITSSESPHCGNLLVPPIKGVAESHHVREHRLPQLPDRKQQFRHQAPTLFPGLLLQCEEYAQLLREAIDRVDYGKK